MTSSGVHSISEPTRNCNILDLFFLSDHLVIYAETLIPVHDSNTVQIDQNLNPPSTRIEILDFNMSNWPKLKESLNNRLANYILWNTGKCVHRIDVAIDTISEKLFTHEPNPGN